MTYRLLPLSVLLAACTAAPPAGVVEFRREPGSGMPNLAVGPEGRAVLTWLEPAGEDRHALRFAVRAGGRWSEAGTIAERDDFFVNWADFPSLVVMADGRWVAHWLQKTAPKPYAYHVMLSSSTDGGRTWSAPVRAHADSSDTEHGFVAMAARPAGGADLVWLDGRAMDAPEPGPMSIRGNQLAADGRLGAEVVLDDRTCECCQTAVARTGRGLVAAYRDRTPEEIRDIAVVREVDGQWTAPVIPAPDHWEYRACPVNGPALAADGDLVAMAWYTGTGNQPAVYLIQSGDAGATWGERIRLDAGAPLGRVHLTALGGGAVAAVWLEGVGEGEAEWRLVAVSPEGRTGGPVTVARVSRARLAGFPRTVRVGGDPLVAYSATGDSAGVRVIRTAAGR
jgi:hypothetical protein